MAITSGHNVICCDRNRRGGLKTIFLTNTDDILSFTDGTAGTHSYSAVTMVAPGTDLFYKWEFDRGTAGFTATATRENGSTLIDVSLEFYIPKVTGVVNFDLMELVTSCGITAVVETYADDCVTPTAATYKFVLGWDNIFEETAYMEFTSGEETTGVGLQDANGTAIIITTQQGEYPREFTGDIAAAPFI